MKIVYLFILALASSACSTGWLTSQQIAESRAADRAAKDATSPGMTKADVEDTWGRIHSEEIIRGFTVWTYSNSDEPVVMRFKNDELVQLTRYKDRYDATRPGITEDQMLQIWGSDRIVEYKSGLTEWTYAHIDHPMHVVFQSGKLRELIYDRMLEEKNAADHEIKSQRASELAAKRMTPARAIGAIFKGMGEAGLRSDSQTINCTSMRTGFITDTTCK